MFGIDGGDGYTMWQMHLMPLNYTLTMVKMINMIHTYFTKIKNIFKLVTFIPQKSPLREQKVKPQSGRR